jgi:hypothetical protein
MSGFDATRPATQPLVIHRYVRVANWLREQIVSGEIPLGEKLPRRNLSNATAAWTARSSTLLHVHQQPLVPWEENDEGP